MGSDCLVLQPDYDNTKMLQQAQIKLSQIEILLNKPSTASEAAVQKLLGRRKNQGQTYSIEHKLGAGCFGTVFRGYNNETREVVAIKAIPQDPRYESRELQLMKLLIHPNIVCLHHCFYARDNDDASKIYVNLVMEFVPEPISDICHNQSEKPIA